MVKGKIKYLLLLAAAFLVVSCGKNVIYSDSNTMQGKTWRLRDIPVFKVPVTDTINSNNIYLVLRTGSSYPYRNIFLFVTTFSPERKSITDTLEYDIADEKGNWYGKGFGDIHELKLPYKKNVFFPVSGEYQISVQHGMRIEDLKGVYDLGLRVEKTNK
jgi:gliding motility-associated lipoprotein GldH